MKKKSYMKKFGMMMCCVVGLGFLLSGCGGTVSNITNSNADLVYNGNSAAMVDGYLYYGNAFADYSGFSSDKDYKKSAKISYLARLNTNIELAAKTKDYSPKEVEKVAGEVAAHGKDFMFVLDNYIYYAAPNRQKATDADGNSAHYFNYTSLYRSNLNGNNKSKIYTTNGEVSQIEVLKYGEKYYVVMLAGEKLIKIQIGNKTSVQVVAEDVKSLAIPKTYQKDKVGSSLDWNGYIFYTVDRVDEDNSDISGTNVHRILISEKESEIVSPNQGKTVNFIGRENDVLFYTMTGHETEVFKSDITGDVTKNAFINSKTKFYSSASISNIALIATEQKEYGYIFATASGATGFVTKDGSNSGIITFQGETGAISSFKTLMISGRTMYILTSTKIFRADLSSVFNGTNKIATCSTIVSMTAIYDGTLYAYDGTYIYYYAKLETVEFDEDDENYEDAMAEKGTDENYYLYRARAGHTNTNYELLGKTQIKSRQTL